MVCLGITLIIVELPVKMAATVGGASKGLEGRDGRVRTLHSRLRPWPATEGAEADGRRWFGRSARMMRAGGAAEQGEGKSTRVLRSSLARLPPRHPPPSDGMGGLCQWRGGGDGI